MGGKQSKKPLTSSALFYKMYRVKKENIVIVVQKCLISMSNYLHNNYTNDTQKYYKK